MLPPAHLAVGAGLGRAYKDQGKAGKSIALTFAFLSHPILDIGLDMGTLEADLTIIALSLVLSIPLVWLFRRYIIYIIMANILDVHWAINYTSAILVWLGILEERLIWAQLHQQISMFLTLPWVALLAQLGLVAAILIPLLFEKHKP